MTESVQVPNEAQSENKLPENQAQAQVNAEPAAEQTAVPAAVQAVSDKTAQPAQQPIVIQQKGGRILAGGALVLSLLALGASGFLFTQGQNSLKNQELQLQQQLDKAALGNSKNADLLQSTLNRQTEIDSALEKVYQAQKDDQQRLANTERAYQELLKGRVNWLVDETEATLNLASQQLLLSGNVPVAVTVLESIEHRLSRFEQPELLPIKQAVSQDLANLKNRPYLNIPAASLRLDRLESAAAGLPLVVDNTLKEQSVVESLPQSGSFWQRTWDQTVHALKGMVEVRRLDNNDAMLMSPGQVYFVRENLRLRLLDARLALMQHNGEVYQNDLASIEAAVKQYFDLKSPTTQSWLKELGELKALDVRMVSDESLKASLAAVRSYQDSVRTSLPVALPENAASAPAAQSGSMPSSAPASGAAVSAPAPAASVPTAADKGTKA